METLVERETILPANDQTAKPCFAANQASSSWRMLDQMREAQAISRDYRDAFVRKYPMSKADRTARNLDSDSPAFIDLMAARVPEEDCSVRPFVHQCRSHRHRSDLHAPGDLADVRELRDSG